LTVSFIGVISFIGIIIPSISRMIVGEDIKQNMIISMLLGGLLVITTDLAQRVIFNPMEIPVGLVIGLICAPLFLIVMKKEMK
jgi:iron complex transport system permease protein